MDADTILGKAKHYLLDVLGDNVVSGTWGSPWPQADQLPIFLQNHYTYHRAALFGHACLLMMARAPEGESPAVVRKHWQKVSAYFEGDVIYLVEHVSSYNRKRLIEQRVPFLVPGNQLYIPLLGIDLREYFRPGKQPDIDQLGAPAQVIVLREILKSDCSGLPAKVLAQKLGYSPMTITRAVRELTDLHLAETEKVGKAKHLRFLSSGHELWKAAQPTLQNPVTKRISVIWCNRNKWGVSLEAHMAGQSALAHYTSLADPGVERWAITSDTWSDLAKRADMHVLAINPSGNTAWVRNDREATELEIWAYNPTAVTSDKSWVDPLSLWLSFSGNTDERVDIAREFLLEQVWSALPW